MIKSHSQKKAGHENNDPQQNQESLSKRSPLNSRKGETSSVFRHGAIGGRMIKTGAAATSTAQRSLER